MPGGTNVQTSLQGGTSATGAQRAGNKTFYNGSGLPWWAILLIVALPCGAIVLGLWLWLKNRRKKG